MWRLCFRVALLLMAILDIQHLSVQVTYVLMYPLS